MYTVPLALLREELSKALLDTVRGFGKTKLFQGNYFRLKVFLKRKLALLEGF